MDLAAIFPPRFIIGQIVISLVILCLGNAILVESSPGRVQIGHRNAMLHMSPYKSHQEEYAYEEDYSDEDNTKTKEDEMSIFVDACESEYEFIKMANGINPDSRLVHLYPSTYVYTTRCRAHQAGKSCRGLDEVESVCRPKKSWVQVYGRLAGEHGGWQQHWIAVDSSCSCLVKTPFSSYVKKSK